MMYLYYLQTLAVGKYVLREGDWISVNGTTGEVILGKQPLAPPAISGDLGTFMTWVDEQRQLKVVQVITVNKCSMIMFYN